MPQVMHGNTTAEPLPAREIDRSVAVLALILASSVTEAVFMLLPSFVGALADVLHLSDQQLGILGSADLAGIAVSTATGPWWVRRARWRRVASASLGMFLLTNVLGFVVHSFTPLVLLRVIAGLSAGVAFTVALAGIVDTRRAARNTALMVGMQVVFGAVGVYAIDVVPAAHRLDAVYAYILIWLVPLFLLSLKYFPDDPGDRPAEGTLDWRRLAGPGTAAVLGAGLYFLMVGAVWGYLEGVAREAGLTLDQTGEALSVGLIVSLVGSGAAAATGLRYGRAGPLIVTAVFQIGSLYLLTRLGHYANPVLAFYVINAVFQIFWSYIIAYFIIIFNDVDATGRFVSFYGTATHVALAVGPYVGAQLIAGGRHQPVLWFGIVSVALCYVSFLAAVALGRSRPSPSASAAIGG
jgi:predicted MFS family arabinose efflux permease